MDGFEKTDIKSSPFSLHSIFQRTRCVSKVSTPETGGPFWTLRPKSRKRPQLGANMSFMAFLIFSCLSTKTRLQIQSLLWAAVSSLLPPRNSKLHIQGPLIHWYPVYYLILLLSILPFGGFLLLCLQVHYFLLWCLIYSLAYSQCIFHLRHVMFTSKSSM